MSDLDTYPHITLTSPNVWELSKVSFPSIRERELSELEAGQILQVTVGKVDRNEGMDDYCDPYLRPMHIYNVQVLNSNLMKINTTDMCLEEGPLSGDRLHEPKTFLSTQRHSNTTTEDLREMWITCRVP